MSNSSLKAIKYLHSLEKKIDIDEFTLANSNIWPIVRLCLWQHLTNTFLINVKNYAQNVFKKPNLKLVISNYITSFKTIFSFLKLSRTSWFLFITRERDQTIFYRGKKIDQVVDPIYEKLVKKNLVCKKLQISPPSNKVKQKNQTYYFFFIYSIFVKKIIKIFFSRKINKIVGSLNEVELKIRPLQEVEHSLFLFLKYYFYYYFLLRISRPELIFLSCYYTYNHFGLIASANKLGIPTLEIQHGKQGKNHGMYSNWKVQSKFPLVIPKNILLWGLKSKENIDNTCSTEHLRHHKTYVLGNLWASIKSKNPFKYTDVNDVDFIQNLKTIKYKVLITLQPIDNYFPDYLFNAIKSLSKDYGVLIRFHPSMSIPDDFMNKVKKAKCYVDVNNSTTMDLYSLLSVVDYHITAFSSVCYEAYIYGISTLLFSPEGKYFYQEEIDKNIFEYSQNTKKIISSIINGVARKINNQKPNIYNLKNPYMIINDNTINNNLFKILKALNK